MTDEKDRPREWVEADVANDRCPKCRGELDTGWECNDCGYDARPIAVELPEIKQGEQ